MMGPGHGKEPDIQALVSTLFKGVSDIVKTMVVFGTGNQKDRDTEKPLEIEKPHIRRCTGGHGGPENALMHGGNVKSAHTAHGITKEIPVIKINVIGP